MYTRSCDTNFVRCFCALPSCRISTWGIDVISHHHSTISFCDDVVILSGGRVKKQAPFGALASLSMDELYQHEPFD